MNRFSRFNNVAAIAKATENTQAENINDIATLIAMNAGGGEFQFTENADLSKYMRTAKEGEITLALLPSGAKVNRIKLTMPDGTTQTLRAYGVKGNEIPARPLTADEIKNAVCGFCSDAQGEITEEGFYQGRKVAKKVFYWKF